MMLLQQRILFVTLALSTAISWCSAAWQAAASGTTAPSPPAPTAPLAPRNPPPETRGPAPPSATPETSSRLQPLLDFQDSDVKFNLQRLMNTLRDSRHEGWVLAAYPDPKTSRPLIGAGFSLDVAATDHLQTDVLNPNTFLEPSSAELWQAAGLDSARLQRILDQYDRDLQAWSKKKFRKKIKAQKLTPEITQDEALQLLRISSIQAIHNARAYCRYFDQLTASQQMALSQLVFQMGVNLEEFSQFLAAINDPGFGYATGPPSTDAEMEHWKSVQTTLIQSQWARKYKSRAIAVIAMFDPDYDENPREAERKVKSQLRPAGRHHKKGRSQAA